MDEWETLANFNWAYWVAGFFALAEFFKWLFTFKDWLFKTVGIETKDMRKKREWSERLKHTGDAIKEIKETSQHNVNMFLDHERQVVEKFTDIKDEIVSELGKLHEKIDEQQERLDKIDQEGKKRDCAVFRDRILGGMRYFGQQKDENGVVHVSMSDYENMNTMFNEYFKAGGNGTIRQIYETEFVNYKIDTDRR
jgi:hypothetical protein